MKIKSGSTRRSFLRNTAIASSAAWLPACSMDSGTRNNRGSTVSICYIAPDPIPLSAPGQWAIQHLAEALQSRGIAATIHSDGPPTGMSFGILVTGPSHSGPSWPAESYACATIPGTLNGRMIGVNAADPRGLVYALTDLADRIRLAADPLDMLLKLQPTREQPALRTRSIMRLFVSELEDKPWFYDRDFWSRYLTLLAASRFNRFNLAFGLGYDNNRGLRDTYLYFAYPYLLDVPGFQVRVNNIPAEERDRNLATLRFISDETARRGLHFQLGIWTHAYEAIASPQANHLVEGLTPETHGPYCRAALQMLLRECPNINGITFRIHGESGVAEGNYDLWKTIFSGTKDAGRPILIDMHAKGMDDKMIDTALSIGNPVSISPKFWAEHLGLPYHQAAIRELEMPKATNATGQFSLSNGTRSFLRYGYGDLLTKDRKYQILYRIWPGTQRFLLWADPAFASDYGRRLSFGGAEGYELFDPLSFKGRQGSGVEGHRTAYTDSSGLQPAYDHEKFTLTYRLWGRLTYNPDAAPETWKRQYDADFGDAAGPVEAALAAASRILPLVTTAHLPSAANLSYWPEIYTTLSMTDGSRPGTFTDTPSPKTFPNVSPIDPQMFATVTEYVDAHLAQSFFAKISPAEVAFQLDGWADAIDAALAKIRPGATSPVLLRAILDTKILALTGRFFAHKHRAAIGVALFTRTNELEAKQKALAEYRQARDAWADIIRVAGNSYVEDITFGPTSHLRGHWSTRLAAIDADIAAVENFSAGPNPKPLPKSDEDGDNHVYFTLLPPPALPDFKLSHTPPRSFARGKPLTLTLIANVPPPAVKVFYRHVNQAEQWISVDATPGPNQSYQASIPADYTNSSFAIQYYFACSLADGKSRSVYRAQLLPGFAPHFRGQPYFTLNPQ